MEQGFGIFIGTRRLDGCPSDTGSIQVHSQAGAVSLPKWGTRAWRSHRSTRLPHRLGSTLMGGQWELGAPQCKGSLKVRRGFPKIADPQAFTISFWLRLMISLMQLPKRWICRACVVCHRQAKSCSFPTGKRLVVWTKNSQKAVLREMWFQNNLIFFGKIASLQPVSPHSKWFHCPADECSLLWSLKQLMSRHRSLWWPMVEP